MANDSSDDFPIPDPPLEPPVQPTAADEFSLEKAVLELKGYAEGNLTPRQKHADWRLRFWLRTVFFFFALCINLWWEYNVRCMIWQSGHANSGYHLSDSVLVALLTTSIANFLALLIIIAKHLFGTKKE